jgi:hypothetical protein
MGTELKNETKKNQIQIQMLLERRRKKKTTYEAARRFEEE